MPVVTRPMELTLELDDDIYSTIEKRTAEHGFNSTEEYCRTILSTVIEELEEEKTNNDVEKRLEDLGYLS